MQNIHENLVLVDQQQIFQSHTHTHTTLTALTTITTMKPQVTTI